MRGFSYQKRLSKRLEMGLPEAHRPNTSDSFLIRQKLEISQEKLARMLGVSHRTVWRWEQPSGQPDGPFVDLLKRLLRIVEELQPSMPPAQIADWLVTPNDQLRNCTPVDLIRSEYGMLTILETVIRQAAFAS